MDNIIHQMRSYLWVHMLAGVVTLLLLIGFGTAFFFVVFRFLLSQEPFGPPLMERLLGIVLLAFFSMLTFSNLIITLTTTYISKETEFLFALPLKFRSLFLVKLSESVFYSSWAFVLLSLPVFAAYGMSKNAPVLFYPVTIFLLGFPFLVTPACLGAILTMIISAYLPARKARLYTAGLLVLALLVTGVLVKLMGLRGMVVSANVDDFSQIMALLNVGSAPLLPNFWLARGAAAASRGEYLEAGYWALCLISTALMSLQVCLWLVPKLYYRGWSLAKESSSPTFGGGTTSVFPVMDKMLRPLPQHLRALTGKDMRTFWRDPAQWSQLVILFGLLVIYIANIRGVTKQFESIEAFVRSWRLILSYFNLAATCFVLSILTTRFVYPLLSLEGKQYWVINLAPFPKSHLLWQKFGLCASACLCIGVSLMLFSNAMLGVPVVFAVVGFFTICLLSFGLTSLSVGLGAIFPNFKEDNPARIANGLGGTVNIVASLFYIGVTLAIQIPAMLVVERALNTGGSLSAAFAATWAYWVLFLAFNALVIFGPMALGHRRWKNLEFHF